MRKADQFARRWLWGSSLSLAVIAASIDAVAGGTPAAILVAAVCGAIAGLLLSLAVAEVIVMVGTAVGLDEDGQHLRWMRTFVQNLDDLLVGTPWGGRQA